MEGDTNQLKLTGIRFFVQNAIFEVGGQFQNNKKSFDNTFGKFIWNHFGIFMITLSKY